jgi:hypothetical protein
MYAQLHTVQSNIASLVKPITSVQRSYAPQLMQLSNTVTPHISSTIRILITATLFLLRLQFPQLIIMHSIAHRQNHTTIK